MTWKNVGPIFWSRGQDCRNCSPCNTLGSSVQITRGLSSSLPSVKRLPAPRLQICFYAGVLDRKKDGGDRRDREAHIQRREALFLRVLRHLQIQEVTYYLPHNSSAQGLPLSPALSLSFIGGNFRFGSFSDFLFDP